VRTRPLSSAVKPGPLLVSVVGTAEGSQAAAAALACAIAVEERAALLFDVGVAGRPRPTVLASSQARELEERFAAELPEARSAARGVLCRVSLPEPPALAGALEAAGGCPCVVHAPPELLHESVDLLPRPCGVVLRAELASDLSLTALAVGDLRSRGLWVRVLKRPLGWIAARRALAGALPGTANGGLPPRLLTGLRDERGQALILALGGVLALIAAVLALVAIAGAVAGKGRVQRAADLAAVSAARSMRDDLPRLLAPARLPGGAPNPARMEKRDYLERARLAAAEASVANGVAAGRVRVRFPDRASFAPLRARAIVSARLELGREAGAPVVASATAEAAPPGIAAAGETTQASGGGYGGALARRQGEGMRPDVAAAFDRMAAAATAAGHSLLVTSGFRSDAEQAELFAANPDPTWVAPPGRSLHRCATELDLGPPSAYAWLAANAGRFGFVKRYSWEDWHFGYEGGPPPCSTAGDSVEAAGAVTGGGGDGRLAGSDGLPSFVPDRYRAPLSRAASRWNVSAVLLAAQLMAESNFDPDAVSPAGAQGIAQFIPSTAAAYGLRDPFDPEAAIDAQARLMADLLEQFGSPQLALAAYNAGPAPVSACGCVPDYPETQAYVARILALLEGTGASLAPPLEVRLVA